MNFWGGPSIESFGRHKVSSAAGLYRNALNDDAHFVLTVRKLGGRDEDEAAGVGTPVPGGLSYREAHLLMEILGDSERVHSLDIVEINPILDDRNKTAELAVELAASLLGQRIL